ncbi:MAG: type II toxin-antitoxin system Phd/YefM family antitoxin [Planctomycetes bacterium]|nr:type II toxin-antitoxin system Phd/YefM family antitoxin [Planctomycetota bacterium]
MALKPSRLRQDIYRLLDEVLATGRSLEISRNGERLKIVRDAPRESKLARLQPHDCIVGDPESLVHVDWSKAWRKGRNL